MSTAAIFIWKSGVGIPIPVSIRIPVSVVVGTVGKLIPVVETVLGEGFISQRISVWEVGIAVWDVGIAVWEVGISVWEVGIIIWEVGIIRVVWVIGITGRVQRIRGVVEVGVQRIPREVGIIGIVWVTWEVGIVRVTWEVRVVWVTWEVGTIGEVVGIVGVAGEVWIIGVVRAGGGAPRVVLAGAQSPQAEQQRRLQRAPPFPHCTKHLKQAKYQISLMNIQSCH